MALYEELFAYIEGLPVVDAHEHLPPEAERLASPVDFFTLFSVYCLDDLLAAGLTAKEALLLQGEAAVAEKWAIFAPYYARIRDGSYSRAAHLTMARFYDLEELHSLQDAEALSEKIRTANQAGLYQRVWGACNIVETVNFMAERSDPQVFRPVVYMDAYVEVNSVAKLRYVEAKVGRELTSLPKYVEALGEILQAEQRAGVVGVKFLLAYWRTLAVAAVPQADAEQVFNRIVEEGQGWREWSLGYDEALALQDYITHRLIEHTDALGLPVVFHTGIQSGEMMKLPEARPELLWPLLARYRDVRFNILHAGLPWMDEAGVMAKQFANLTLDLSWSHTISPAMTRRALKTYIDLVPLHKLIGFGGDQKVIEKVYGHLTLARQNTARVLAELVAEQILSEERARVWARAMFHDNPAAFYGLDAAPLAAD